MVNYRFLNTLLPWMAKETHNFLIQTKNWLDSCTRMNTNRHMVNRKFYRAILVFALFMLYPLFSQVAVNGKVQVNTGWLHLTDPTDTTHDLWTGSGYVQLSLETEGSQTIKGYISGSYSVNSPDMATGNTMATSQSAFLDRAYVKIRLPWLDGRKMRLNIGKMPVSWGYGMMYNAGDIIFGATLPSDGTTGGSATSDSLNEMRAQADWFVQASLPLFSSVTFEPLLRLPLSQAASNQQSSFGGRFLFTPYWKALERAEIGYLASRDGKTHYAYAGIDGNLYVDYNLCAQVRSDTDDTQWVVSGALAKAFTFTNYDTGYELPVSISLESLWKPTQDNHSVMFVAVSAQVTDILGLALNWIGTLHDGEKTSTSAAQLLSASLTLSPIGGLEFTLSSSMDAENPANMANIAVGATYRF